MAAAGLVLAGLVVALAIVVGGTAARALNGVGALLWVASGVLLAISLPRPDRLSLAWGAAIVTGGLLGAVIRPGTFAVAIASFAIAGAVVVLLGGDRTGGWALMAPAIYLPVHLAIGIGRALMRGSEMRVAPPPTAALLPLSMVIAALLAGAVAAYLVRSRG
jgi:polyferredoxin